MNTERSGRAIARPIQVTISGSFRRHISAVYQIVEKFQEAGLRVLSPEDPRIVDAIGQFMFVASDRHRSIRLTEDRHLDAIRHSEFLWLVCPDGYVGPSASLEIGFALAHGVPVLSDRLPDDDTHRHYVEVVASPEEAAKWFAKPTPAAGDTSLLIDPSVGAEEAHVAVDNAAVALTSVRISESAREACYTAARERIKELML